MGDASKYVNWSHLNKSILSQVKFLCIGQSQKRMSGATPWRRAARDKPGANRCNSYKIPKVQVETEALRRAGAALHLLQQHSPESPQKSCRRNAVYFAPATLQGNISLHSFRKKWTAVRQSPSLLSLFLSQTSSSLHEQTGISLSKMLWALRAFQDPATCDFQQVFSLKGANLLAAATHLKELAGVLVSRLKRKVTFDKLFLSEA